MAKDTNWSDFQKNVSDVLNDTPQGDPVDIPTITPTIVPKTNIWLIALLVLAVSLGITIFFSRSNTELNTDQFRQVESQKVESKVDELQSLKQEVDLLKIKVRILGAQANNNAAYQSNPTVIFIEKDWKLSKNPPNLQKNEADIKFLQEWSVQ